MMQQPIKVGLAAYGMSGEVFHAPLLNCNKGFELTKILERKTEKSKLRYKNVEIVRTFDALISDADIELVVINTPDNTHYDLCKSALLANKHVVVEKPFVLLSKHGQELIELAEEKDLVLSVFQNRRWDGDYMTVRQIVDKGLVGRLVEYESHFDRYRNFIRHSWKEDPASGSGTLYNLGSHLIDQALDLFGFPLWVYADINIFRTGGKVDDRFVLNLGYRDVRVTLKASYLVREPSPRYILHGTNGSFVKSGIDPQEEDLKSEKLPDSKEWGKEPPENWGKLNTQVSDLHFVGKVETLSGNYQVYYDNIYDAIRNKKELIVTARQANATIKIIEAAILSNEEQQRVTF